MYEEEQKKKKQQNNNKQYGSETQANSSEIKCLADRCVRKLRSYMRTWHTLAYVHTRNRRI